MRQLKKEYVTFSTKINNYLSKIMVEEKIDCEKYHYSLICKHIKSEGVVIREYPFKGKTISGLLIQDQNETTIGVNQHLTSENKNFVIGHELTHFLFHLNQKNVVFIDTMKELTLYHHQVIDDFQANIGALAILVPDEVLIYFLKQGWTVQQVAKHFGISINHLHSRLVQMIHAYIDLPVNTSTAIVNSIQYNQERTESVALGINLEIQRARKLVESTC